MDKQYNIVQYEFFHIQDVHINSLEDGITKSLERTTKNLLDSKFDEEENSRFKTVVRIYDVDGQVTRWAEQIKSLKEQREVYLDTPRRNFFTNWFARTQISQLDDGLDRVRRLMISHFTEYIDKSSADKLNVAKETHGHAFRSAKREEFVELQKSAVNAKHLWMFIFEPNDLFSEENTQIISIM